MGRSVLLQAGGACDTERAGLAVGDAVLAARPAVRARVGLQPHRAPLRRPRRGALLLVATRARAGARCGARGRPRLCPGPVSGRPIDRAPARADRVSASRDAARARAQAPRLGGDRAHGGAAVGPDSPRHGSRAALGRLCVGAAAARRLVEGSRWRPRRVSGRGARGAAGRGRLGRERRTAVRAGAVLFRRARGTCSRAMRRTASRSSSFSAG